MIEIKSNDIFDHVGGVLLMGLYPLLIVKIERLAELFIYKIKNLETGSHYKILAKKLAGNKRQVIADLAEEKPYLDKCLDMVYLVGNKQVHKCTFDGILVKRECMCSKQTFRETYILKSRYAESRF